MAFADSVPVLWVPAMALVPAQAPEAAHAVALAVDQLRLVALPLAMELGLALSTTLGAGAFTDTEADWFALPPGPVQVNVNVELAVRVPVDCVPWTALVPDQAPDAVHVVALAAVQFSVAMPPLVMALGPTLNVTVGGGDLTETVTDCAALPPGPVHDSV
jgi:hypothetical protein